MSLFKGAGVALITPFNKDKSVNYDELGRIIDRQIEGKTDALIVCGTTGEPATMTEEEKLSVIEFAVKRNDPVSVNHRIAAFLASYVDIIFALNEVYHPGEKRMIKYAKKHCKILPENFEENINELFRVDDTDKLKILNEIVIQLKKILPLDIA